MSKIAITSPELAPPVGPFSQAIKVGVSSISAVRSVKTRRPASWWREVLAAETERPLPNLSAFSRRPARVSMMSCALVCISRAE